ncbi:MAG TPA: methyltransferase domain-containing protein [Ktedonobacterales bacterium]|nr:methyltransferase domain-containing protein [Ktedonobacterales bacterium]
MSARTPGILGFDHVQVTAPRNREAEARSFYRDVVGLSEIAKPEALVSRGGAWYQCGDLQLHLGLEDTFTPQQKAHPAFRVSNLDDIRRRLEAASAPITIDVQLPGCERFETRDPFGNRLEFLRLLDANSCGEEIKQHVRDMFGPVAEAYVASPTHAAGDDLERLLELAAPRDTDIALDVSTGGGHTALTVAPYVARVVASDLTPRMLAAARRFIQSRGQRNVEFVIADAERLPFLDETFDLVTVRIAPHHYADIRAAVAEMARVLVPGGRLVLIDNIAAEDPDLDAAVNDWDKRRDPSHVREYTVVEWRSFLDSAGLRLTDEAIQRKTHPFAAWVERMRMPAEERDALEADMLTAPERVRRHFEIIERGGHVESWASDFLIARASK